MSKLESFVKALTDNKLKQIWGTNKTFLRISWGLIWTSPTRLTGNCKLFGKVTKLLEIGCKAKKDLVSTQMCLDVPESMIQNLEDSNMGFKAIEKHVPVE